MRYLIGLLAFWCLALVACSSGAAKTQPPPSTTVATPAAVVPLATQAPAVYTLTGSITAPVCDEGYALDGAAVEVRDEHNTLIGTGSTTAHEVDSGGYREVGPGHYIRTVCVGTFTVEGLPKAAFYQVRVGTHGGPAHSFDELQAAGWHLDLNLK